MSGKKKTIFNGEVINEAQKMTKEWSFAWSFGAHLLRVGINFEEYHLVIDSLPFMRSVVQSVGSSVGRAVGRAVGRVWLSGCRTCL